MFEVKVFLYSRSEKVLQHRRICVRSFILINPQLSLHLGSWDIMGPYGPMTQPMGRNGSKWVEVMSHNGPIMGHDLNFGLWAHMGPYGSITL